MIIFEIIYFQIVETSHPTLGAGDLLFRADPQPADESS
jgi:hypothetical protein